MKGKTVLCFHTFRGNFEKQVFIFIFVFLFLPKNPLQLHVETD